MDIRPRTTGEILDDAWHLVLADAPLLLALSGLFTVPAAIVILLLLTSPVPPQSPAKLLGPGLLALLLPLTGLGSGACQAVFRRRAEEKPVTILGCLGETLLHGLDHVTVRAVVLVSSLVGVLALVMPGLAVWAATATAHPVLAAGPTHWFAALTVARQEGQRQPVKSAGVTLARLGLLLLAAINLHAILQIVLWTGDHLLGLDLALAHLALQLGNPVYDGILLLQAWLLLAPYAEASNYLLHVDARARYEGLDLWYRVRRLFPAGEKSAAAVVLLFGLLLGAALPAWAADAPSDGLRQARQEIARLRKAVEAEQPFPGGAHWSGQLRALAAHVDRESGRRAGPVRWFARSVAEFEKARTRSQALALLEDIDQRLGLVEESLAAEGNDPPLTREQLRALLPPDARERSQQPEPKAEEPAKPEEPPPVRRMDPAPQRREAPARPQTETIPREQSQGLDGNGWSLLAGLLLAVGVTAWVLSRREAVPAQPPKVVAAPEELTLEAVLRESRRTPADLWRQADELARTGKCLDAVRTLYLAVLLALHRAGLIRVASTRTNGEYLSQVRSREDIYRPFRGLTGLFEVKWYGERACAAEDYAACRRLAEAVRASAEAGASS